MKSYKRRKLSLYFPYRKGFGVSVSNIYTRLSFMGHDYFLQLYIERVLCAK